LQPLFDVIERFLVGDVVNNNDAVSSAVITGCNGSKSFLSCCVPNLQLDCLSLEFDGADFEVDSDGGDVALCVSVVGESKQKTRLAHTRITDQQQLEKVVIFWIDGRHLAENWFGM